MSFRARILEQLLLTLRDNIVFEPVSNDDISGVSPDAIYFRRLPAPGNGIYQPMNLEESPCIVISSRDTRIPSNEGENNRDDWAFSWLIQICSKSLGNTGANQSTFWEWQEKIADQLNFNWLGESLNDERGCLREMVATMIDEVDERQWSRATTFICGIMVTTIVRKKRRVGQ